MTAEVAPPASPAAAPLAPLLAPQLEATVAKYISLRDKKASLKKKFTADTEAIDALLDKVESYFMGHMAANGLTSLPTKYGTPYLAKQTSATVADRSEFKAWLAAEPERFDEYCDLRANKTAIAAMVENEQDLPPGINWTSRQVVNVTRKS